MKTDLILLGLSLFFFNPLSASDLVSPGGVSGGQSRPTGAGIAGEGVKIPLADEEEKKKPSKGRIVRESDDDESFKVAKSATNSILVFKGEDGGQGTGFVVKRVLGGKDRFFVYTNQHVIAGGKTIPRAYRQDGSEITLGKLITAVDYDLAVFTLDSPEENFLEIQGDVSKEIAAGENLATPGNAGGGSTITMKYGKVVAIGPELVEIDALIKGGNSGGPIIHENGKVIGIVAFFKQETKDDPRIAKVQTLVVRRFGYRVDNVKSWETPDWKKFSAQGERFAKVEALSKDLIELVKSGFESWNGNEDIGKIMRTVRKNLDTAKSNKEAYGDIARAYTQLKVLALSDLDEISKDASLYWWWKHNLKDERKLREHLNEEFDNKAKEAKQKR